MLQRLRIKNFKLLRDVELELNANVPTVLIGANSSGKSTVIEVLDFLSRCANDGLAHALVAHGGMNAVRTIGVDAPVEIETDWRVAGKNLSWTLRFGAQPHGAVVVDAEMILSDGRPVVTSNPVGQRTVLDETERGATGLIDERQKLAFEALVDPVRYESLGLLRLVIGRVRVIGALSTAPSWARASAERASARDAMIISTEQYVGRVGIGLATALYNLQVNEADVWNRVLRALKGEFPFVKRIVFPPDPGGGRIAFAIEDERFPERLVYSSEMSDGMVAFLGLLTLILHPHQLGVLALDEPDAHLHPSAVRRLLALAHEPHPKNGRVIIIVTHSNAVLEELVEPAASIRVVESTPDGTRIRKLDADALVAWRSQYTMSELRQTGLLDPSNGSYGNDE